MSRIAFIILLTTLLYTTGISAQTTSFWGNNVVVGISPGMASYYGDLSIHDTNPIDKLIYESGPEIGIFAGKKLKRILEFGVLATIGKTSSEKPASNIRFLNKFNEFGVYSVLSVADILVPQRTSRFDYGFMANYSITQWRSVSLKISDEDVVFSHGLNNEGKNSGNGQSKFHHGGGYYVSYALNPNFTIRLSQSMQFMNTDEFDSFIGGTKVNDRILHTGVGLIFTINPGQPLGSDFEECPTF